MKTSSQITLKVYDTAAEANATAPDLVGGP